MEKKICFRKGVLQGIVGIVATWTSFLFPFFLLSFYPVLFSIILILFFYFLLVDFLFFFLLYFFFGVFASTQL